MWKTAERAGIGKISFQRAKAQLRAERYLFEWRRQGEGGRWVTVQLVSNTPLTPEEAHAALRPPPLRPTAAPPATGAPSDRPATPQPRKTPRENTPHPAAGPREGEAEALLLSLGRTAPALAMPARKARNWAPLAAAWLARGMAADDVRRTLLSGLEQARSPLGALRWRLEHALPEPASPRPEPRVAAMRECAGPHTQSRLFTPVADEERCPGCRTAHATAPRPPGGDTGLATFRAARAALACASPIPSAL